MTPEPVERTCTRCGTRTSHYCPTCTAWWETRPDAAGMTPEHRADELDSWKIMEIEFAKFHQRAEELVGRPVWTHEFADFAYLRHEILTGERPSMEGVFAKLPADKPVIMVAPSRTEDER